MIYRTRGEHANHYAIDVVEKKRKMQKTSKFLLYIVPMATICFVLWKPNKEHL